MTWFENTLKMRNLCALKNFKYLAMADAFELQHKEDIFGDNWLESYLTNTIIDVK